jgi:hypothetical protein
VVTHAYADRGVHEVELAIVTEEDVLRIREQLRIPFGDPPRSTRSAAAPSATDAMTTLAHLFGTI